MHCLVKPRPTKCQEPSIHVKGSNLFNELHPYGKVMLMWRAAEVTAWESKLT